MVSTSWAVSYFRSLKRSKVLKLVTQYLVRYKKVCIPHIGTFELVQQPPRLDVAAQQFDPPVFTTRYSADDQLTAHQSAYFANGSGQETLTQFGSRLKHGLRSEPLQWNGFGLLRYNANELVFEPQELNSLALQPVPARKVIRQDVHHNRLVGDREIHSEQDRTLLIRKRYPWSLIIGWTMLALAVAAIIFFLYQGGFQPSAAGLR